MTKTFKALMMGGAAALAMTGAAHARPKSSEDALLSNVSSVAPKAMLETASIAMRNKITA